MNPKPDLEGRIIDFLQQQKTPKAASQIVKQIRNCDKKTVNSVLYRLKKRGMLTNRLEGSKPLWSLLGDRPALMPAAYYGQPNFRVHPGPAGPQGRNHQWSDGQPGTQYFGGNVRQQQHHQIPHQGGAPFPYHPQHPLYRQPHPFPQHQQWPRGRGRGGRGSGRGQGKWNRNSSAPNHPGSGPAQRPRFPPNGASNSGWKGKKGKFTRDRNVSGTMGTAEFGDRWNSANAVSTRHSASSSGLNQSSTQNCVMKQMAALNSALNPPTATVSSSATSQTHSSSVNSASSSNPRVDTSVQIADASDAAVDSMNVVSRVSPQVGGEVADNETSNSVDLEEEEEYEEDDCEMDDCEYDDGPNITTRFQDMMGTLVFNEDMMEGDSALEWVSIDLILLALSSAPGQAMTISGLAVALKTTEEQVTSALSACGDRVEVREGVCTLSTAGRAMIQQELQSCAPLAGQLTPKHRDDSLPSSSIAPPSDVSGPPLPQGDNSVPAPSSSLSGPPPPPEQWIESHSALFSAGPSSVERTSASAVCGVLSTGVPQQGGTGRGKDDPSAARTGRGIDPNSDPSTALLSLSQGRERGRGRGVLAPLEGKKPGLPKPSPAPGRADSDGPTVSGILDVRELESTYFSIPPSAANPASCTPTPSQSTHPSSSGSSNKMPDFTMRRLDEFDWKPLTENRPPGVSQSSMVSSSSQSSLIGQNAQVGFAGSSSSEPSSKPSVSFSLPTSSSQSQQEQVMDTTAEHGTAPQTSVPGPAAVNSQTGQTALPSPTSLHPSLQKFAAEGLTLVVSHLTSGLSSGSGSDSVPFQPPPTPLEVIERQMGKTGLTPQPSGPSLSNSAQQQPSFSPFSAGPSSLTFPQSHNAPHTSNFNTSPVSLPAPGATMMMMEGEGGGGGATLQITSESFAALNKNPISALMEHAQSRGSTAIIEVVGQRGPSHRPVFVMAARVGSRQFPGVSCHNKKDGKKEAADLALRTLIAEGQMTSATPSPADSVAPENMTHFDRVAALTHNAFNTLMATIPENLAGRKVIAGLVMKRGPDDLGVVISLGTGNRCITGDKLSLEGNTVNDSHAEIITRRGFMRFLYQQLLQYREGTPHLLFEPGCRGQLRVKNSVTFHLYISTAPCGDGALFSPRDMESNSGVTTDWDRREHQPTFASNVQGLLRTKMEGGEGTIPVDSKSLTQQTWDGVVRGERLRTMSCTDKICRWNVLGMQGALLSHFLEPVYLDSLTLGFLYDHGHLSRAVCCRLARQEPSLDQDLPPGYRLNHPWLGRVTACQPLRETQKTKAFSINWVIGDTAAEVLDGTLGHCYTSVEKKLFSRVCKRQLYDGFQATAKHLGRSDLCEASSYHQAKVKAAQFQAGKAAMFRKFQQLGCGWVKKPMEEEMFS